MKNRKIILDKLPETFAKQQKHKNSDESSSLSKKQCKEQLQREVSQRDQQKNILVFDNTKAEKSLQCVQVVSASRRTTNVIGNKKIDVGHTILENLQHIQNF